MVVVKQREGDSSCFRPRLIVVLKDSNTWICALTTKENESIENYQVELWLPKRVDFLILKSLSSLGSLLTVTGNELESN